MKSESKKRTVKTKVEPSPDIFLYNANIERRLDLEFIQLINKKQNSDRCLLILVTYGGNPDAAYKIGRYIQQRYDSFRVLVPGFCKSAGTLLAIAAEELTFAPFGELGPLDVLTPKEDKLVGFESGLNISEAFRVLEDRTKDTFHTTVTEIVDRTGGIASIKTAMQASAELVSSMYRPIFAQIDPEEVGSRTRSMRIVTEYAKRLNTKWNNITPSGIEILSGQYPSHSFVIDYTEAETLFRRVGKCSEDELQLIDKLGTVARIPLQDKIDIRSLSINQLNVNEGVL